MGQRTPGWDGGDNVAKGVRRRRSGCMLGRSQGHRICCLIRHEACGRGETHQGWGRASAWAAGKLSCHLKWGNHRRSKSKGKTRTVCVGPALGQNQFPEAFTDHLVPLVWNNPQPEFSPRLCSRQEQSRLCYIQLPPVHSYHISTPWPSPNPSSQGTDLCWKYFLNRFFHFSTPLQCMKPSLLYYSTWPSSQACEIRGAGISIPILQMRRLRHGMAKCLRLRGTAAQSRDSGSSRACGLLGRRPEIHTLHSVDDFWSSCDEVGLWLNWLVQ